MSWNDEFAEIFPRSIIEQANERCRRINAAILDRDLDLTDDEIEHLEEGKVLLDDLVLLRSQMSRDFTAVKQLVDHAAALRTGHELLMEIVGFFGFDLDTPTTGTANDPIELVPRSEALDTMNATMLAINAANDSDKQALLRNATALGAWLDELLDQDGRSG